MDEKMNWTKQNKVIVAGLWVASFSGLAGWKVRCAGWSLPRL